MGMPTKEQWAEVEQHLSGMFGRVELLADGYTVVAEVKRIAAMRMGVVVYVNGYWKGEWFSGEAEEPKKFHQEKRRFIYPAKAREEAKKWLRKRGSSNELKDYWKGVAEKSLSQWAPYWTNPKAMTRKWRETCTDIQIVKVGYAE